MYESLSVLACGEGTVGFQSLVLNEDTFLGVCFKSYIAPWEVFVT